jgi:hypothetical protein
LQAYTRSAFRDQTCNFTNSKMLFLAVVMDFVLPAKFKI